MINLHILCGIPASGKSTWAKQQDGIIISRDVIRKELVGGDKKAYFSKEKIVFNNFATLINLAIDSKYKDIYVDATHLNEDSRRKIIKALGKQKRRINLTFDCFPVLLDVALIRNNKREGFEYVPVDAIRKMYMRFSLPVAEEMNDYKKYGYDNVNTIIHYFD